MLMHTITSVLGVGILFFLWVWVQHWAQKSGEDSHHGCGGCHKSKDCDLSTGS